jgi:hypothetical protein
MIEYNPVVNRINWIIAAKSPNKFNSRTCQENLTTAYGNHVISTGGKIQINLIRGNDTQFADFAKKCIR